jgi:hypothetical protein
MVSCVQPSNLSLDRLDNAWVWAVRLYGRLLQGETGVTVSGCQDLRYSIVTFCAPVKPVTARGNVRNWR